MRAEFSERTRENASYSLRQFARDLGMSPSLLSGVLSEKNNLSPKMAIQVSERLGMSEEMGALFCDLVSAEGARSSLQRLGADERLKRRSLRSATRFDLDRFQHVADWHHLAICSLVDTEDFRADSKWIAKRLGIDPAQAQDAWERLQRLEILIKTKQGWKTNYEVASTWSDTPSQAIRNCHRGLISQAVLALETQDVGEREISSIVLSASREKMARAKELIREFQAKFMDEISSGESRTDVFCINVQFVNLSSPKQVSTTEAKYA